MYSQNQHIAENYWKYSLHFCFTLIQYNKSISFKNIISLLVFKLHWKIKYCIIVQINLLNTKTQIPLLTKNTPITSWISWPLSSDAVLFFSCHLRLSTCLWRDNTVFSFCSCECLVFSSSRCTRSVNAFSWDASCEICKMTKVN